MPFSEGSFFDCAVRGFSSNLGWNEQKSSMSIQLVEDDARGDVFTPVTLGTPVSFTFGSFTFAGLLQHQEKKNDQQGLPVYEVTLEDPREILAGCQVILNNYTGTVASIPNLQNAFGYWEATGFGNALANSTGMPWYQVKAALEALINQPNYLSYGGPLTFRGIKYGIDLSYLPSPPAYYRVGGGVSASLLEIISQLCDDGGCDYFVDLVGYTIRIRTASRFNQPPLGTITTITDTNWGGTVLRSNNGLEIRNEVTSAFLVGGFVSTLHYTDTIKSFWGYDINGLPILGTAGRFDFTDSRYTAQVDGNHTNVVTTLAIKNPVSTDREAGLQAGDWPNFLPAYVKVDSEIIKLVSVVSNVGGVVTYNVTRAQFGSTAAAHADNAAISYCWGSTNVDYATLNASEVADIIGSTSYTCSTFEMRMALVDFNSWAMFIYNYRQDVQTALGLASPIRMAAGDVFVLPPNMINDGAIAAQILGQAFVASDEYARQHTFYEFVKKYAQAYMGKKYAVSVPFLTEAQDPETLKITTNYNVSEGGYLPDGSAPLGLSIWNEDVFKNQDGTFRGFVRYDSLTGANVNNVPPESALEPPGAVVVGSKLFVACQVDPNLITDPAPYAVITLGEGLFDRQTDTVGSLEMAANVMMQSQERAREIMSQRAFGSFAVRVFPAHRTPAAVAVPLRSNVLVYGPWYATGAVGKVRFEADPTLVPWEYGGYTGMDSAAATKVTTAVTNMQVSEAGAIELAGMPAYSLGDVMAAGGPNVTNIQVSYGINGVTTAYTFRTYTPRFGTFTKGNAERLKKLGQTSQELRRALRTSMLAQQEVRNAQGRAANAARVFMQGAPPAINPATPHDVLFACNALDTQTSGVRAGASSATFQEAVVFTRASGATQHKASATMSLSGLIRPFSTKRSKSYLLPSYIDHNCSGSGEGLTLFGLNPWKAQNDIEVYSWGETYDGLHAQRRQPNYCSGVRGIGLRAPMVAVGWGYDWEGNPFPGTGDAYSTSGTLMDGIPAIHGGFASGYLTHSDWWGAGPIDMLFDRRRGVWTVHDVIRGRLAGSLAASGSASLTVYESSSGTYTLPVYSWFDTPVASGDKVFGLFSAHDRKWYALRAGEKYYFHSPEFETEASGDGTLVSANWGLTPNIQTVGYANQAGTTELFARADHIHAHGTFATGNFHPEYQWPTGSPYEVMWMSSSGTREWQHEPILGGITLGGTGVDAEPGYVAFGRPENDKKLFVQTQQRSADLTLRFPANSPSRNDLLRVSGVTGTQADLEWTPWSVIDTKASSGIPLFTGRAGYTLFNTAEHDIYVSDGDFWWKFCHCGGPYKFVEGSGSPTLSGVLTCDAAERPLYTGGSSGVLNGELYSTASGLFSVPSGYVIGHADAEFNGTLYSNNSGTFSTNNGVTGYADAWFNGTLYSSGSGLFTGSGGSGGGPVTACGCSIPATLYATPQSYASCTCFSGTSVTLTHNGTNWTGTGTLGSCGRNVTLTMRCPGGGSSVSDLLIDTEFPDACSGPTIGVPTASGNINTFVGAVCSPFSARFWNINVANACGCAGSIGSQESIQWQVTE